MTFDEFKVLVKGMKCLYTSPNFIPDGDSMKVWYAVLGDLPYEIANICVQKYSMQNKFPPTVADIRELSAELMMGEKTDWSESWQKVCRFISLYGMPNEGKAYDAMDEYTKEAVKRIGWKNLCMSQNVTADRANYRMIYESVVNDKKRQLSIPENMRIKIENIKLIGE